MLDAEELTLAALLLARRPLDHMAEVTGMTPAEVEAAVERMLRRLIPARAGDRHSSDVHDGSGGSAAHPVRDDR
jgi:hypothetical protein